METVAVIVVLAGLVLVVWLMAHLARRDFREIRSSANRDVAVARVTARGRGGAALAVAPIVLVALVGDDELARRLTLPYLCVLILGSCVFLLRRKRHTS